MQITKRRTQLEIEQKMMDKQILIFVMSPIQSRFEAGRVEEEAKALGYKVRRAMYRELSFKINETGIKVLLAGEEISKENTMGVWFRVAGTKSGKYVEARNMLIRNLREGVFCDNAESYLNWPRMGKISQHGVFIENEIPVVPTRIFYTKDQVEAALEEMETEWGYPMIAKHERGYQGKSVRKFDNRKDLLRFVKKINEKNLGMFLWQKCLLTRWNIRVVVVGGKAIGGMKRSAQGEEFRSNFSLGGAVEKWELSPEDKVLAEKVAKVCGLDYCGVDIMKDGEGNSYILEVNRQCQFQGFEKSTGINVARMVVEMLSRNP